MLKIWSKIKSFYITNSQRKREISDNREISSLPNREMATSPNQKTTSVKEMVFVASTGASTELVNSASIISDVKSLSRPGRNSFRAVEVGGIDRPAAEVVRPSGKRSPGDGKTQRRQGQDSTSGNVGTGTPNPPRPSLKGGSVLSLFCPYCSSANFVKRGTRQKKGGKVQLYICNDCQRTFTPAWTKNRQHSWSTMLEAISYYNLGFSLAQTCDIMKQKFQIEIQPSTVAIWVEDNKEICAYHRMRDFAVKHFSPYEVVETCTLAHRQLYRFRYHHAKIKYIMEDDFKHYKFYPLKEWLDNVSTETPHQYFQEGLRASEAPLKFSKTEMIVRSKENYATKLTEMVFKGVSENKARHEALQRFLIANDTVTVATEVPVYLKREDLAHMMTQLGFQLFANKKSAQNADNLGNSNLIQNSRLPSNTQYSRTENSVKSLSKNPNRAVEIGGIEPPDSWMAIPNPHQAIPTAASLYHKNKSHEKEQELKILGLDEIPKLITGHIDFLQIRNGSVHILDYKSNAAKERPIEQLTLYALALSRLTGLRLFYFKCAWFDEKDYFEFFPLHVVYKPGRGRKKIYTKEGVYNMNEKMNRMASLRPIDDGRVKVKIGKPNF